MMIDRLMSRIFSKDVREKLVGRIFSKALINDIQKAFEAYRAVQQPGYFMKCFDIVFV